MVAPTPFNHLSTHPLSQSTNQPTIQSKEHLSRWKGISPKHILGFHKPTKANLEWFRGSARVLCDFFPGRLDLKNGLDRIRFKGLLFQTLEAYGSYTYVHFSL